MSRLLISRGDVVQDPTEGDQDQLSGWLSMGGSSSKSEGLQEEELVRKLRSVSSFMRYWLSFAFSVAENTRTLLSCAGLESRLMREFPTSDLLRQVGTRCPTNLWSSFTLWRKSSGAFSGLYFKLRKYNLPYPEAVFDGGYFRQVKSLARENLKPDFFM